MINKKYQIYAMVLVCANGFVKAKNKVEAKKKWEKFCFNEMCGLSVAGIKINEVVSPVNKYYDKDNVPDEKEFEFNNDCITNNYLN